MKTVFSNAQCAHVWAAQSQPTGRSGTMLFDGPTIYSYGRHYPIASFQRGIVLFNSDSSTMTTSGKHKPAVHSALRGLGVRVIQVPGRYVTGSGPRDALAALVARREECLERAMRSRKYADMAREDAGRAEDDARAYAAAFDLPAPVFAPADDAAIKARIAAQRAAAKVENAKRAAERAEYERLRAVELAKREERWQHVLAAWRTHCAYADGELPAPRRVSDYHDKPTAIRLSRDGTEVETSRGASVPIADARKVWGLISYCKAHGAYAGGPDTAPVGAFSLRSIDAGGTAVIGCHTLEYAETLAFATAQGWNV